MPSIQICHLGHKAEIRDYSYGNPGSAWDFRRLVCSFLGAGNSFQRRHADTFFKLTSGRYKVTLVEETLILGQKAERREQSNQSPGLVSTFIYMFYEHITEVEIFSLKKRRKRKKTTTCIYISYYSLSLNYQNKVNYDIQKGLCFM